MRKPRPILVSGSHRSGGTWIGKMLALAPSHVYVHEPFNRDMAQPGKCLARFPLRYTYVTGENEAAYLRPLRRTVGLRFNFWAEVRARPGQAPRALRDALGFWRLRAAGKAALVKDPFALFAAPWLADRFDMQVVVVVRHPAAFAGSLKRFGWFSPLGDLLAQPLLLRDWLAPYAAELAQAARQKPDLIGQAALMWRVLYGTVARFREQFPEWLIVRHEDVSRQPVPAFARLYQQLGLTFTAEAEAAIAASSSPANPPQAPPGESAPGFRLDSRANVWNWKQRLTAAEIGQIRQAVASEAALFYGQDEW